MGDWQGSKCKYLAAFSLRTKRLTLMCIYGDSAYISGKLSRLLFCFRDTFARISKDKWFVSVQTRTTDWFDIFSRMHFVIELVKQNVLV